jgi:hypothetical protein
MSTYYSYYLRAPLADKSITGDEFRELALKDDIYFDTESGPIHNVSTIPYFGPSTDYDGPDFDFEGLEVADGILKIGVFASNLQWPHNNEEDDIQGPQGLTRLEVLFAFLSRMTTGEPGEVQGTYGSEHSEYRHGHPILRCADDRIRVLMTNSKPDYDWYHGPIDIEKEREGEKAIIPGKLPGDLVDGYEDGAFLKDISKRIVDRLRPVDGTTQKLIG